ncbi:hypothetical protein AWM75_04480 [Aerococcus urinaehominis]|uniref:Uncharacterized protein n=1 Tax=Aerococcus urinaehominis TaxID=128944 RepID=A0A0X8FL29_9LACT|nr:hypothetical protein [Aerococcus urinaehominis]AMB99303.1 hypothetical protein AWM75_04480 [Aerococcus urinaehominis]SDM19562.1 hypothetical protein SAMN04487985_10824 [Aerococcus urinaehominis]
MNKRFNWLRFSLLFLWPMFTGSDPAALLFSNESYQHIFNLSFIILGVILIYKATEPCDSQKDDSR